MSEEVKKDLAQNEEVVEKINVVVDTREIKEVIKETFENLTDELKQMRNIPGPAPVRVSKEEEKILERYSFKDAILKIANPKEPFDGIYKEMHEEARLENERAGVSSKSKSNDGRSFMVPSMIHSPELRATLKATVAAAGGNAVATDMLGLIETLRNSMVIMQAGATLLPGLEGDVAIPRRSADSTAYWRSEGGLATQSDPTYEQITMEPHRLTAFTRFSRQFLRQSSFAVENEVRDVLNYAQANELEQTAFDGAGSSNQPEGIFNNSSVNNADHGSNGTLINWNNVVNMEGMIATDNALRGSLAYVTNASMGAYLKTLTKTAYQGGFVWENFTPLAGGAGMVNGYPAYISNVLSNALTKGTGTGLSPIIFGNWKELILGQWGAQEYIIDPYTRAAYDEINVIVVGYWDYALRHPESFATIEAGRTS
jgi:HK97 family phage major capsid protein